MRSLQKESPRPLCSHVHGTYKKDHRMICHQCGSFYDLDCLLKGYRYSDDYAAERRHCTNRKIGFLKVKTMMAWLRKTGLSDQIKKMNVCEVGFGGGQCLEFLKRNSAGAWGVEITSSTIDNAAFLGIPKSNLFSYSALPEKLPQRIDLWLFQDSFEHIIENLDSFLRWVGKNSNDKAQILLVAPQACSLSQKIMGRYWPHKTPDHLFHWSYMGLCELLERFHFIPVMKFFPVKYINLPMALIHLSIRFGFPSGFLERMLPDFSIPFNFGEMGILFEKNLQSDLEP